MFLGTTKQRDEGLDNFDCAYFIFLHKGLCLILRLTVNGNLI